MYNELLTLLILFIVYLFPQSMIINGLFLASAGSTEVLPDGTYRDSEMILYPLAKYFNQKIIERIIYKEEQFDIIIKKITDTFPTLNNDIPVHWYAFTVDADQKFLWLKQKHLIESTFGVLVEINEKTSPSHLRLYKEYPVYRFSKYIRKPLFGCIICMASFWGVFTFLIPVGILFNFNPVIFALYVPNTLCLSYLNYKLYKPL